MSDPVVPEPAPETGRVKCDRCDGTGIGDLIRDDRLNTPNPRRDRCKVCDGTGMVDPPARPTFTIEATFEDDSTWYAVCRRCSHFFEREETPVVPDQPAAPSTPDEWTIDLIRERCTGAREYIRRSKDGEMFWGGEQTALVPVGWNYLLDMVKLIEHAYLDAEVSRG